MINISVLCQLAFLFAHHPVECFEQSCVGLKALASHPWSGRPFNELAGVDPELTVNQTWHLLNSAGFGLLSRAAGRFVRR